MAQRETAGGQTRTTPRTDEVERAPDGDAAEGGQVRERHEKLSDDVDAILDEIDEALEENAEDFVRSYVQKGGE